MASNLNWVLADHSHVTASIDNSEYTSLQADDDTMSSFPPVYINLSEDTCEKNITGSTMSTDSCFDVSRFLRSLIEDIANLKTRITQMTEVAMKENMEQTLVVLTMHSIIIKIRLQATVDELEFIVDKIYKFEEGPSEDVARKKTDAKKFVNETSSNDVDSSLHKRTVSCETESLFFTLFDPNSTSLLEKIHLNTEYLMDNLSLKMKSWKENRKMGHIEPILSGSHSFNMDGKSHIRIVNTMGTVGPLIIKTYSDEMIVVERCLNDSEELEFGFDPKSDGSTVFRIYATLRFDGLVEMKAKIYEGTSGQGTEDSGFWFRGDGLYRGDYKNGRKLKLVKKWRP